MPTDNTKVRNEGTKLWESPLTQGEMIAQEMKVRRNTYLQKPQTRKTTRIYCFLRILRNFANDLNPTNFYHYEYMTFIKTADEKKLIQGPSTCHHGPGWALFLLSTSLRVQKSRLKSIPSPYTMSERRKPSGFREGGGRNGIREQSSTLH